METRDDIRRRPASRIPATQTLLAALIGLAVLGCLPAAGSPIYYDQGLYSIHTDTNELFLGRYGDGTPIPTGSFLYQGRLAPDPLVGPPEIGGNFGIAWSTATGPMSATDVWEGVLIADPGALISHIYLAPVYSGYLQRWYWVTGSLQFDLFSDPGYTNLLGSEVLDINWTTDGPKNINEFGVYYLDPVFDPRTAVYARFTQHVEGWYLPLYAGDASSTLGSYRFELSAETIEAPLDRSAAVPEPGTLLLLLSGVTGLASLRRQRGK